MIDEFNLASALGSSDLADGADSEHWKELHRLRMDEYRENHGALGRLQANAYQHNIDLLRAIRNRSGGPFPWLHHRLPTRPVVCSMCSVCAYCWTMS
jgi:hypothetical protein